MPLIHCGCMHKPNGTSDQLFMHARSHITPPTTAAWLMLHFKKMDDLRPGPELLRTINNYCMRKKHRTKNHIVSRIK